MCGHLTLQDWKKIPTDLCARMWRWKLMLVVFLPCSPLYTETKVFLWNWSLPVPAHPPSQLTPGVSCLCLRSVSGLQVAAMPAQLLPGSCRPEFLTSCLWDKYTIHCVIFPSDFNSLQINQSHFFCYSNRKKLRHTMLLASKNAFRDSGSVYIISICHVEWLADAILGEGEPPTGLFTVRIFVSQKTYDSRIIVLNFRPQLFV